MVESSYPNVSRMVVFAINGAFKGQKVWGYSLRSFLRRGGGRGALHLGVHCVKWERG